MAGKRSFDRGESYYQAELVSSIVEYRGVIRARVLGTREYEVKLRVDKNKLEYFCSCPLGAEGVFCKHCVAAGLKWIESNASAKSRKKSESKVTIKDIEKRLLEYDTKELVKLLVEHAVEDDRLRNRLTLKIAGEKSGGINLAAYRQAIDDAARVCDFMDYTSVYEYARGINEAVDAIDRLLKTGYPGEAIELSEYALKVVEDATDEIDDSSGSVSDIMERLEEMHLKACEKAGPDPEELAKMLFDWELNGRLDTFSHAVEVYSDILGEKGLAVYRKLAEAEWKKLPPLTSRDRYGFDSRRYKIKMIKESLARMSGDVEALVEVEKHDLSSSYRYYRVAEIYMDAGEHDLALEWAEKGLEEFPDYPDFRLVEFLADEYHRRKKHDEAMKIIWALFKKSPRLEQYKNLKKHAKKARAWKDWREKAIKLIRKNYDKVDNGRNKGPWSKMMKKDHSTLVEIFLWEMSYEKAWREAKKSGCSEELWMKLAARREKKHPEDALPIVQKRIETVIARKNNNAYKEAVSLLKKVKELLGKLGKGKQFKAYLDSIRAKHKRKRNLMKMIDRAKWN